MTEQDRRDQQKQGTWPRLPLTEPQELLVRGGVCPSPWQSPRGDRPPSGWPVLCVAGLGRAGPPRRAAAPSERKCCLVLLGEYGDPRHLSGTSDTRAIAFQSGLSMQWQSLSANEHCLLVTLHQTKEWIIECPRTGGLEGSLDCVFQIFYSTYGETQLQREET